MAYVRSPSYSLVLIVLGRIIAVFLDVDPQVTFAWMPFRADGLIVGSLIAVALHAGVLYERVRPAVLLTVVGGFIFAGLVTWFGMTAPLFSTKGYPLTYLVLRIVLPCALSVVYGAVLWVSLQRNLFSAFLSSPVFKPLALYSYGIFIIHNLLRPIFENTFGPQILVRWTGGHDASVYLYFVLSSSISFVLAMASYHLIEIHFLRLKSNFSISAKPSANITAQAAPA
jgi:peptidoglycan/LPS O-acetylase OafA/YrhL